MSGSLMDHARQSSAGSAVLDAPAIVVLEPGGRIRSLTAAVCRWLGYAEADLLGRFWHEITAEDDQAADIARFARLWRREVAWHRVEKRWRRRGAEMVSGQETAVAMQDPAGPVVICSIALAESSSAAADKRSDARPDLALHAFLEGMAHESRNALQQIGVCAEMLAMEIEHMPTALDLVTGVQEAAHRMLVLFNDANAWASPLEFEPQRVDLKQVWRAAWSSLPDAQKIRLIEQVDDTNPEVMGSTALLQLALRHLLENAVQASNTAETIELICGTSDERETPMISLSIRDFGSGFSETAQQRGCELFYSSRTRGTGLGLPIVQRIVDAHGGRLQWGNHAQGGACVELRLPAAIRGSR